MSGVARLALLLCLCIALGAAARGHEPGPRLVLERPAPGETAIVAVEPGMVLVLAFPAPEVQVLPSGDDLILLFDDGAQVVLRGIAVEPQRGTASFDLDGRIVPAELVVSQAEELARQEGPELENAASADPGFENLPDLRQLRYSGRDLLFPGETERKGHPLYSYLLYAGASDGDREERERFRAAIESYIGQLRSAEALESRGAARGEINIFYAPMKAIFADTTPASMRIHFAQRLPQDQVALLLNLYDYARAEVLLARLRLTGDGPYIVSVLRPLTQQDVSADEAFLVQDLSSVPPQLVALWVDEFKRQVVQEATDSPEHLRRLALNLRTQIAVLAEAFAITKSAVAEMFEEPKSGGN